MYYRFIILFCLFSPSILFSQFNRDEIKNQTDENGLKQGEWEVKHENSNAIRYKGQFKDDQPFGKFQYYYPTGEISGIMSFYNSNSSLMKMYHKNGGIKGMNIVGMAVVVKKGLLLKFDKIKTP